MRTCRLISYIAASMVALAPVQALAQDTVSVAQRPRPDYDPLGARVGGFDLAASVDFSATSTDNLFATETNEIDDVIFAVAPNASLNSHWSRHALGFDAGATFRSLQDISSEDAETGYFGANGRLDIGSNSAAFGSARLAHEVESRADPDASIFGPPVEYDTTYLSAGARHTFNRFSVQGTFTRTESSYDAPQNFRDSEENAFSGRVDAQITPRIGALFEATVDERDYDSQPGLSSDGRTYLAGVTLNLSELLNGQITVGQFDREYEAGSDVSGLAVDASLEWYATRLTTVRLGATRNGQDVGASGTPYTDAAVKFGIDHELLRNLILTGDIMTGEREYENIDRDDTYSRASLQARYLMNRRVVLHAGASRSEGESDGADRFRDYEVNQFTVGATLRL